MNDDVARLEQMLRYSMAGRASAGFPNHMSTKPTFQLSVHRLYSQDFMSLVSRHQLFHD